MSYRATISFKTIEATEIYEFFKKFKAEATNHLEEIAKDNFLWSPYSKEREETDERKLFSSTEMWARSSVFSYRYFYLAEHKLLALFGVPNCLQGLFDLTVCFQNSCDQDYDFDEWKGIPIFEKIAEKWKNSSDDDVHERFEYPAEHEEDTDYDYYRRTFAYDEIWEMFEDYLYQEEKVVYISLYGYYDISQIMCFSRMCKEQYENWEKEIEEICKKKQQDHQTEKGGVE